MIELTVAPHTEALADPGALDRERLQAALNGKEPMQASPRALLYHQWRTYQALGASEIVVNSYNTGTGKTQAALLRLLDLGAAYRQNKVIRKANVLFIAPTNELLRQHEDDVRKFISQNALPHKVLRLDAARIRELARDAQGDAVKRSGDSLEKMLNDPGSVLRDADGHRLEGDFPFVLVTNPDIFYYALFGLGNAHDRRVLTRAFMRPFNYTIVDEFHYYNAKQFANFLFFFTLLREGGYFAEEGRRICLLTATPNPEVNRYLERLAVGRKPIKIDYVQPQDEPAALARTPALAPLRLRLYAAEETTDGLVDLAGSTKPTVDAWLAGARHGAFVSSALWRINRIYEFYGGDGNPHTGRLTGAERAKGREQARTADLMMATPTVDIGYNFDRPGKTRQSLDFLLFDASYAEEFTQRLGRAARILGKAVVDSVSDVWAVVPDKLVEELRDRAGGEITRVELTSIVQRALQPRNGLFSYISSGAIAEAIMPIYQYQQGLPSAERNQAEALFETLREVYGVKGGKPFKLLCAEVRRYHQMRPIIDKLRREADSTTFHLGPASLQARKLTLDPDTMLGGEDDQARQLERTVIQSSKQRDFSEIRRDDIEAFYVMEARFNFRDSFDPPQALVYDPGHYLSSEPYNSYSAMHIAQNYKAIWAADARQIAEWIALVPGQVDEHLRLCCTICAPLEPRLTLWLHLPDPGEHKDEWESRYLYKPAALRGFRLIPAGASGGQVSGELNDLFAKQYFAFYGVSSIGPAARRLNSLKQTTALFTNTLTADFGAEGTGEYLIVLGTAALMVEADEKMRAASHLAQRAAAKGAALIY